jgi:hypothetical protein
MQLYKDLTNRKLCMCNMLTRQSKSHIIRRWLLYLLLFLCPSISLSVYFPEHFIDSIYSMALFMLKIYFTASFQWVILHNFLSHCSTIFEQKLIIHWLYKWHFLGFIIFASSVSILQCFSLFHDLITWFWIGIKNLYRHHLWFPVSISGIQGVVLLHQFILQLQFFIA